MDRNELKTLRDRHRAECPGLRHCLDHPVVNIARKHDGTWGIWGPKFWYGGNRYTFPEAMAAAIKLTEKEKVK